MKKIALALTALALMAGPMVSTSQAAEKYYLLTDCTKVEDPAACRAAKIVPGAVVGGLLGVLTGGVAFWALGGELVAGASVGILGTTVGIETALGTAAVTGAVVGGVTAATQ